MNAEDLGALFSSFRRSAFRLETLPEYRVPQDADLLTMFLNGRPQPAWHKERPWLATVAEACASRKVMQRVRVVRPPLTDYLRFQLAWGYPTNVAAGEDIRILELGADDEPPGMVHEDYWLFDDAIVVRLEYDEHGSFLRPVEVRDVAPYRRCRDAVMARAVRFEQYRFVVQR